MYKSLLIAVTLGLTGCSTMPVERVLSCNDKEVGIGIDRAWKHGNTWEMVHVKDYYGNVAKTSYTEQAGEQCQLYIDTGKDYAL